jgi:hypothetical protein
VSFESTTIVAEGSRCSTERHARGLLFHHHGKIQRRVVGLVHMLVLL